MSYPQGIAFCADPTLNVQTSPNYPQPGRVANRNAVDFPTYPITTTQGNTVGWEGSSTDNVARDRSTTDDKRICGLQSPTNADTPFRFDLPSAGSYNIGFGAGDASYIASVHTTIKDSSTVLGTLANGSTGAANSFFDAAGNIWTAANWPANNVLVPFTFSTTIARFQVSINTDISFAYIESNGSAPVFASTLLMMGV